MIQIGVSANIPVAIDQFQLAVVLENHALSFKLLNCQAEHVRKISIIT